MLQLSNVSVLKLNKYILHNVTLDVARGEILSLIGKNGAGKSSVCRLIVGSLKPTKGKVIKEPNLRIAYVPQMFHKNLALPLRAQDFILMGQKNSSTYEQMLELAKSTYISDILTINITHLSGGEFQKVLVLRALVRNPDLLILDESFSFLDLRSIAELHNIIFSLQKELGFSIILVSHDINFVLKSTTRVICLANGSVQCTGDSQNLQDASFIDSLLKSYIHDHTHSTIK